MARDGEILNKSLLQKVANYLNIGGVRRFPSSLNTDQVQMVYDVSPKPEVATPDGGEGEFFIRTLSPINAPVANEIAGETEAVFRLITGDGVTAWRVDTLCVELVFDAADPPNEASIRGSLSIVKYQIVLTEPALRVSGQEPAQRVSYSGHTWLLIR